MIKWSPSPCFAPRSDSDITAIIIHDTEGYSCVATLAWIAEPTAHLSFHYVIDRNGQIYHCVDDADKAYHAGKSTLHGKDDVNEFSLGIALVDDDNEDAYPPPQIAALHNLCAALSQAYKIPLNRVVGHCHVAADRKDDPRHEFPWREFIMILGEKVTRLYFEMEDARQ